MRRCSGGRLGWGRAGKTRRGPVVYAALGLSGVALSLVGCVSDSQCGICDPKRLVLHSLSGPNYRGELVHALSEGTGEVRYFVDDIGDCLERPEALESERGPEEYCKLSPLITAEGVQFVFNNLLDGDSVESIRRRLDDPAQLEIYDWKVGVAHIEGPITRYNGDFDPGDSEGFASVPRAVNLSCIDNLRAEGIDFDAQVLAENPEICDGTFVHGGRRLPRRVEPEGVMGSFRGQTDWRAQGCETPLEGPDTCCSPCDFATSVDVARYGIDGLGYARTPYTAIECDTAAVFQSCRKFTPSVDRSAEVQRYAYEWLGEAGTWRMPLADAVRETHPDDRPEGMFEGPSCTSYEDCPAGEVCVGETEDGEACEVPNPNCGDNVGHCEPEWFVDCEYAWDDAELPVCVDTRFDVRAAGACRVVSAEFLACPPDADCEKVDAGSRLSLCDVDPTDGSLSVDECCKDELGHIPGLRCDPLMQPAVEAVARYDRRADLPRDVRECFCGDPSEQPSICADKVEVGCTAPWGTLERADGESNEGHYLGRFVTREGGVAYDPALKAVLYEPADLGNTRRALVEACAEQRGDVGPLTALDGWRMHDEGPVETEENFDRGLCSASDYAVVFAAEGEQIVDKLGNTLASSVPVGADGPRLRYPFSTPEFHVVPDSGTPVDEQIISACEDFSLRLSNKYALAPRNLRKLAIVALERDATPGAVDAEGVPCSVSESPACWVEGHVVAGGQGCSDSPELVGEDAPPCLRVDVSGQAEGVVRVSADRPGFPTWLSEASEEPDQFGRPRTGRYRLRVPGLEGFDSWAELAVVLDQADTNPDAAAAAELAYAAAFHDVCGMPLIGAGASGYRDHRIDFVIDPPSCGRDPDQDGVDLACDNASGQANADQRDSDADGIGDVADPCPLGGGYANPDGNADTDDDGIGNACDSCGRATTLYNYGDFEPADPRLLVRGNPNQSDYDGDGIGDVCDNCPVVANCSGFGPGQPYVFGAAINVFADDCQIDANEDMIGDACQVGVDEPGVGAQILGHAAGPVGFANDDDFDQDGLSNLVDLCPRLPVDIQLCSDAEPCPPGRSCSDPLGGVCNHLDSDGDQSGDACDTCPSVFNPVQGVPGGPELDDPDEDFVGTPCERGEDCRGADSPRGLAFMAVAVEGTCCTTTYPGDGVYVEHEDGSWGCEGLCDPYGFPVVRGCADVANPDLDVPDGVHCRPLPDALESAPGVFELPPGCAEALEFYGMCDPGDPGCAPAQANPRFVVEPGDDPGTVWRYLCSLPTPDQDFDGIGDACDLCPLAFDPDNRVGESFGNVELGYYCSGAFAWAELCVDESEGETGTDTDTDSGSD